MLLGFVVLCVSAAHRVVEEVYDQGLQMLKVLCAKHKAN